MRIAIIGAGYVGLVSAACFTEFGMRVTCVDRNAEHVAELRRGRMPIYEPGLEELVAKGTRKGNLVFTTELADAVTDATAVFIAVGTPARRGDGHADLTHVYHAAREVARHISGYTVIITKSTVPVGTGRELERIIRAERPDADFDICSNPEFLREGSAIDDFMRPDRVIVGCESDRAAEVMKALYRPLYLIETPMLLTTLETAELAKYAANAFLATKITFINEIADLCEKVGADVQAIAKGIGLDGRIGRKFLHAGPGYGGSCFPKDTAALIRTARDSGSPLRIVETVAEINAARKRDMAGRIVEICGGSVSGKVVAILGLTFKPNTDDMRESVSLDIIPALQKAGASIRTYDPVGMNAAKKLLPEVEFCADAYDAVSGADAAAILTEWNDFRALDLPRIKGLMRAPRIMDFRNVYRPEDMREAGFIYSGIGRGEAART